jgi:hypothetical protein
MVVLDPGHVYLLDELGKDIYSTSTLRFVKREGLGYPGNVGNFPGTTTQETLRALIDRARYVNNQQPHWATRFSIPLFQLVIWMYEWRAARRHGLWLKILPNRIEKCLKCSICGHIACFQNDPTQCVGRRK